MPLDKKILEEKLKPKEEPKKKGKEDKKKWYKI